MIHQHIKNWIYVFIFLVLISSTYALTITAPLNNSNIASSSYLINWTNSTNSAYYSIAVYNNTGSLIYTIINPWSNFNQNNGSTTSSNLILASTTIINGFVQNATMTLSEGGVYACFGYQIFYYSDGTTTIGITNRGGTWTDNANTTKVVTRIETYAGTSNVPSLCNINGGLIVLADPNKYYWDVYNSNITIGTYKLNVTGYNSTGTQKESNTTYFTLSYDSLLTITALNYLGIPLTSFSINVIDITNGSSRLFSTTSSSIPIDLIRNRQYNISINASNLVTNYMTYTSTSAYPSYQFTLYPSSSLFISIFDETTFNYITNNVTVTLTDIDNPTILTSTTTNGNISFLNLRANDVWEVRFNSANYSTNRYYRNILATGTDYLNAYLLPNSVAQNFSICWYDSNGVPISNLLVYQYILSNGAYVLTQDIFSDIQGKTILSFNPSHYYLYNYSNILYATYPFILNPPQNTVTLADGCNYDITVRSANSVLVYNPLNITGSATYNNVTSILTFNYTSLTNYDRYSYTISKLINGQTFVICSDSSALQINSFTCSLSGYHGLVYVQGVVNSTKIFYGQYVDLGDLPKLFDNLKPKDAAYYSGFILLIIIVAGITVGMIGGLIAGVIGLLAIYWLGIMTPITATLIIVDVIVVIVIGLAIKRRY